MNNFILFVYIVYRTISTKMKKRRELKNMGVLAWFSSKEREN